MKDTDKALASKNFLPLLKNVVLPISFSLAVIILLILGIKFYIVLIIMILWSAFTHYYEHKTPVQYLKDSWWLLFSITIITWIYYLFGGYGLVGLLFSVLFVAGIMLYRRRKLVLSLVQLWEKTFLGETMEERIERRRGTK